MATIQIENTPKGEKLFWEFFIKRNIIVKEQTFICSFLLFIQIPTSGFRAILVLARVTN
jgi:hypothetical protein